MHASTFLRIAMCLAAVFLGGCVEAPSHEEIQTAFDAGLKAYDAGDYRSAYAAWHSIDNVDLAAMRNIALMQRHGKGVEKNPKAAMEKMEQAADAGLPTAQADLGEMLLNGEAGPPDPKAAAPWLTLTAGAGHPLAAFELAKILEEGTAVPKDIEAARKLYAMAAAAGVEGAAGRLQALPPPPPGKTPPAAEVAKTPPEAPKTPPDARH
jgi:uncharacterized protein